MYIVYIVVRYKLRDIKVDCNHELKVDWKKHRKSDKNLLIFESFDVYGRQTFNVLNDLCLIETKILRHSLN